MIIMIFSGSDTFKYRAPSTGPFPIRAWGSGREDVAVSLKAQIQIFMQLEGALNLLPLLLLDLVYSFLNYH